MIVVKGYRIQRIVSWNVVKVGSVLQSSLEIRRLDNLVRAENYFYLSTSSVLSNDVIFIRPSFSINEKILIESAIHPQNFYLIAFSSAFNDLSDNGICSIQLISLNRKSAIGDIDCNLK